MLRLARSAILKTVRSLGFDIVRISRDSAEYRPVTPSATYSPWNVDSQFLAIYEQIKRHTLVDIYRCWELWTLVEQSAKLQGDLIEIGVWRGGTGALLAKKAQLCGIDGLVYLCDTFRGVVKAGEQDRIYRGGEHDDTSRARVESLLRDQFQLDNVRILEGVFPEETARLIENPQARFRLCHIDVDVYQSAKDVVAWVWERMVVGGIVVYDDYGFCCCEGIARYVNEQIPERDRLVLHNLNGHAIVIKLKESPRH